MQIHNTANLSNAKTKQNQLITEKHSPHYSKEYKSLPCRPKHTLHCINAKSSVSFSKSLSENAKDHNSSSAMYVGCLFSNMTLVNVSTL